MQISLHQQQEQFKVNVLQILYTSGVPQGFTAIEIMNLFMTTLGESDVELIISSTLFLLA